MAQRRLQIENPETVAATLLEGDERTIARVLTLVENQTTGYEAILDAAYSAVGRAWRVGLTGPPGAGKSTLASRLVSDFLAKGLKVAYLGVDPSSPYSGGAVLGDRIRLSSTSHNGRFFARSVATRGAHGGLSQQTEASVDLLDASGFDVIVVESVGVGQAEIDIANIVDTLVVVLVPESGDEIQTMKAGLLEAGDILCVNKADRANSDALIAALRTSIEMRGAGLRSEPVPVVATSAKDGGDIADLLQRLEEHRHQLESTGRWIEIRRERLKRRIEGVITRRWLDQFWTPGRIAVLNEALENINEAMPRPYSLADRIISEIKVNDR